MGLILLGSVMAASDATMATVTGKVDSLFRAALSTLVEAVLADDETVAAAAASAATSAASAAVADQIANGDLVAGVPEVSVTRTSRTVLPMTFRDKTRSVFYPSIYPSVYPPATWSAGARRSADVPTLSPEGVLPPEVIPALPQKVLVAPQARAVEDGPLVFYVGGDGKTYIQDLVITGGGGQSDFTVRRVVIVAALGQSNNVSYAQPVVPMLDGITDRIWQMPYGGASLTPATVPLATRDSNASGLAPAHALARQITANDPECVVVIVPAAMGGSGLVTDSSFGVWAIDYAGANPKLYQGAIDMMTVALEQIAQKWAITPITVATWLQGEQDGAASITRTAYSAALDALIADWKTRFGGVFLTAGIVPQTATSGTRPDVVLSLQDTPRRVESTAFVPGVDNGGGSRGPSDTIHYGREAAEVIGREWFAAIPRASNNVAASSTTPPLKVAAERWGDQVTVSWTPPYCRVTAYEVQSSSDGSTWESETVAEPLATRLSFQSETPVKVRVRAIGKDTSAWTVPVITY